jgi:hypothetical protein
MLDLDSGNTSRHVANLQIIVLIVQERKGRFYSTIKSGSPDYLPVPGGYADLCHAEKGERQVHSFNGGDHEKSKGFHPYRVAGGCCDHCRLNGDSDACSAKGTGTGA